MTHLDLSSKTCLVTGATSGIGLITARELARMGATVIGVGRDPARNAAAVASIRQRCSLPQEIGNPRVEYLLADLTVQADIRRLAEQFRSKYDQLHVLVNNAGAFFAKRSETSDGLETTFVLNHLAPFLLTNLLLDVIKTSAPARIVNVSSGAHFMGHIKLHDLQLKRGYSGWGAYGMSKLANVMFTYELARRLEGTGVTANVLHPGFVATRFAMNNGLLYRLAMPLLKPFSLTPEQGARTCLYLITAPEVAQVTGHYFDDKQRDVRSSPASYDLQMQQHLWEESTRLTAR